METATFDLSKLSTVLNNEVVKRSIYDELVKRIDIVDWFKQTKSWRKKGNKNGVKNESFDWSHFIGKSYFDDSGSQNSLIFQPVSHFLNNNWYQWKDFWVEI